MSEHLFTRGALAVGHHAGRTGVAGLLPGLQVRPASRHRRQVGGRGLGRAVALTGTVTRTRA